MPRKQSNALLGIINEAQPTDKKDKTPTIKPNPDESKLIGDIIRISSQIDDLEVKLKDRKEKLKPLAQAHRIGLCVRDSEIVPSFKYINGPTETLTFVQPDAYHQIKKEHIPVVEGYAADDFDKYFKIVTDFKIAVDELTIKEQDELGKALLKILGEEKLKKVVKAPIICKVQTTYTHDRIFSDNPRFKVMAETLENEGLVVMNAPSFKV